MTFSQKHFKVTLSQNNHKILKKGLDKKKNRIKIIAKFSEL